jgi:hypothetical protein
MNWQPIETAPKDGTDILLWDGEDVISCRWLDGAWVDSWGLMKYETPSEPATHWMPWPEPPR